MKPSRSRFFDVRGVRYHLREWGRPGAPRLFMLHGWMDASATFQFVVDELRRDWHVLAPDWRGFGASGRSAEGYWFPDYLADFDRLAWELSPEAPLNLVGHSMGGNIACLYAGVRPGRVSAVVALDAFGLADRAPEDAPGRYLKWLEELRHERGPRRFRDHAELAARLQAANPRLGVEQADFLARELGVVDAHGGVAFAGDPAHYRVNPVLYRRAEALACWRRIRAPVLWLVPEQPELRRRLGVSDDEHEAGKACFRNLHEQVIADAGHNLHHDQPTRVAAAIEAFLPACGDPA